MGEKLKSDQLDALFQAVLTLQNLEECYSFFEDLCTVAELHAMQQRFCVAKMLRSGHVYADIVAKTGASTATISRVNRALLYGADGYQKILSRMDT